MTRSIDSTSDNKRMLFIGHKETIKTVKTNTFSDSRDPDSDDEESDDNNNAFEEDVDEELENDEKFMQLDYEE